MEKPVNPIHCPFCGRLPKVKEQREGKFGRCSCLVTCEGYCPVAPRAFKLVQASMTRDEDSAAQLAREIAVGDWNTRVSPT
jgi:predicted N-formylglutamate amidohydrolase